MNLNSEINRLLDIMPASGRMFNKIVSKPQQSQVIDFPFPMPWHQGSRPIYINFDLWQKLSKPQRDLLLLSTVSGSLKIKWFKPDVYQGMTLVGFLGLTFELFQGDALGTIVAGGLTAIAASQIWRTNRSLQIQINADEAGIKVATRRGYTETEAAKHLLEAIETLAKLEGRPGLNFTELIRCQNLRAIANLSSVGVPKSIQQE
ncbi:MAG: DUF3318 domain-containing protein [Prochloraceae cyanobacterium]|nr:DUF3318 domain-containing protein [Prochloraceae cyanobacterium]